MEIGSFIELEFPSGKEYYTGGNHARLNSGRAGIYHAARVLGCKKVFLPYYQCETVRSFLQKKNVDIEYYHIDNQFEPEISQIPDDCAIVLVNYFGIMGAGRMQRLCQRYKKVIIDNSQAFFAAPQKNHMNVYSARKFVGCPDGSYVIGDRASAFCDEYEQDFSSDTSLFLLQRIEYGCEGEAYQSRIRNEERIDHADIRRMSKLTHTILDAANYTFIMEKRKENFRIACTLFDELNQLDVSSLAGQDAVPMVYPLLIENDGLLRYLLENRIFQGRWWKYILDEADSGDFEYYLARFMVPITIDQRYGEAELIYTKNLVTEFLRK